MIQGDFYPAKRAKPVGFSGGQFRLVVEPLHHSAGKLFFGAEPVQQQAAMALHHAGDFLHRLDLRPHDALAPSVEEPPRPIRRDVAPEELEVLLEQIAPDGLQVAPQQLGQAALLFLAQPLRVRFFRWFGKERSQGVRFVCSDMWKPYLKVIAKKAGRAPRLSHKKTDGNCSTIRAPKILT